MLSRFLNFQTKNINFSALFLAGSALLSGILGWLRDNLLATTLPKAQADVYLAAFRLPDFLYGIVVAGGLAAAFLPVFSEHFNKSKKEAQVLLSNVFCLFAVGLAFCALLIFLAAPALVHIIVPGFSAVQKQETVSLIKIMSLSPFLLGMSAIFAGVLQYFNVFLATAIAPLFYSLGIIAGLLFFRSTFGLDGLAFGVVAGALAHFLVQLFPAIKLGFKPKSIFNISHAGFRKIIKLMIPRLFSASVTQLNLLAVVFLASFLPAGSILVFSLANNLQGIALSLIGIPMALVAFPILSRHYVNLDKKNFSYSFNTFFLRIMFFVAPISIILFIFNNQIASLLYASFFSGSRLAAFDIKLIGFGLAIFAISLWASCLAPFLSRVFFALHNTKTPVIISIAAVVLNLGLSFALVKLFSGFNINVAILALPLAFSISSIAQVFLMLWALKRESWGFGNSLIRPFGKILIANATMLGFVLVYIYIGRGFLALYHSFAYRLIWTGLACILATILYVVVALAINCREAQGFCRFVIGALKKIKL